jgi:acyl transferase domain-containing protein
MPPVEQPGEGLALMTALGRLWLEGMSVDWGQVSAGERRRRCALPAYPFERQRYWIEPPRHPRSEGSGKQSSGLTSVGLPDEHAVSGNGLCLTDIPHSAEPVQYASQPPEPAGALALAEEVMANQLRVMQSQLEILRNEPRC